LVVNVLIWGEWRGSYEEGIWKEWNIDPEGDGPLRRGCCLTEGKGILLKGRFEERKITREDDVTLKEGRC